MLNQITVDILTLISFNGIVAYLHENNLSELLQEFTCDRNGKSVYYLLQSGKHRIEIGCGKDNKCYEQISFDVYDDKMNLSSVIIADSQGILSSTWKKCLLKFDNIGILYDLKEYSKLYDDVNQIDIVFKNGCTIVFEDNYSYPSVMSALLKSFDKKYMMNKCERSPGKM